MEKEDKGKMIYSATGCSETSVRRQGVRVSELVN